PKVIDRLAEHLPVDLKALKRYHFETASVMGLIKFNVFRSGYTGEDGVEIILSAKVAPMAIKLLAGKMDKPDATLKPAGLGARDTLRLEAAMPLYGHELNENMDPFQAGLGWAVKLDKGDFRGREALIKRQKDATLRQRVGLELTGKRIAREGAAVQADGKAI